MPRDPKTGRFVKAATIPAPRVPSPAEFARRPLAGALRAQSERLSQRTAALPPTLAQQRAAQRQRTASARRNGYHGPLTRADVAKLAA